MEKRKFLNSELLKILNFIKGGPIVTYLQICCHHGICNFLQALTPELAVTLQKVDVNIKFSAANNRIRGQSKESLISNG